jgi:hypothetical protein
MNQKLARKNLRTALMVGAFSMVMFAAAFVVAAIYIS